MPIPRIVSERECRLRRKLVSWLLSIVLTMFALAHAQEQSYKANKAAPALIYPELFVIADQVVEDQWEATLDLVNGPADLAQVEPGQCVRLVFLLREMIGINCLLRRSSASSSVSQVTRTYSRQSSPRRSCGASQREEISSLRLLRLRALEILFPAWRASRHHGQNGALRAMFLTEPRRFGPQS
jgi:hypothetical protein